MSNKCRKINPVTLDSAAADARRSDRAVSVWFSAAVTTLAFWVPFIYTQSLFAGARPAIEDAACESLRLKWHSRAERSNEREINFVLFDAADLGCTSVVSELLSRGASVKARDRAGNSAYMLAARKGHLDTMNVLQENEADIQQTNVLGSNALLMAVTHNKRKAVRKLLELGLDPDRSNSRGLSPLIAAAYNGSKKMVQTLLDAGANPNVKDASGKSPIVYASGKGFGKVVTLLLDTGKIDINTVYGNDLTALMWAAGHSNDVPKEEGLATFMLLLNKGANTDSVDNRGRTALHIAAERGHELVVKALLDHNADKAILDKQGKTALDLAANQTITDLL